MMGRAVLITGFIVLGLAGWVAWSDPEIKAWCLDQMGLAPGGDTLIGDTVAPVVDPRKGSTLSPPRPKRNPDEPPPEPMQATAPLQVFYLDISEIQDRARLLDTLEHYLIKSNWEGYLFLSNGSHPRVGTTPDENKAILNAVSFLNPDLPVLISDAERLLQDAALQDLLSRNESVHFRFFLSPDLYHLSREVLKKQLFDPLLAQKPQTTIYLYLEDALPQEILSDPSIQTIVLPSTG